MWVIINRGRYVKDMKYGGHSSYTDLIQHAQIFETEEVARKNACENESVRKI